MLDIILQAESDKASSIQKTSFRSMLETSPGLVAADFIIAIMQIAFRGFRTDSEKHHRLKV